MDRKTRFPEDYGFENPYNYEILIWHFYHTSSRRKENRFMSILEYCIDMEPYHNMEIFKVHRVIGQYTKIVMDIILERMETISEKDIRLIKTLNDIIDTNGYHIIHSILENGKFDPRDLLEKADYFKECSRSNKSHTLLGLKWSYEVVQRPLSKVKISKIKRRYLRGEEGKYLYEIIHTSESNEKLTRLECWKRKIFPEVMVKPARK